MRQYPEIKYAKPSYFLCDVANVILILFAIIVKQIFAVRGTAFAAAKEAPDQKEKRIGTPTDSLFLSASQH
ncbi:MAG: hypothetical protein LIO55_08555, partial [Oscillospiraceae bacterium]|nr:hypothetical protein [Oscillospiraceae bacterium]